VVASVNPHDSYALGYRRGQHEGHADGFIHGLIAGILVAGLTFLSFLAVIS